MQTSKNTIRHFLFKLLLSVALIGASLAVSAQALRTVPPEARRGDMLALEFPLVQARAAAGLEVDDLGHFNF